MRIFSIYIFICILGKRIFVFPFVFLFPAQPAPSVCSPVLTEAFPSHRSDLISTFLNIIFFPNTFFPNTFSDWFRLQGPLVVPSISTRPTLPFFPSLRCFTYSFYISVLRLLQWSNIIFCLPDWIFSVFKYFPHFPSPSPQRQKIKRLFDQENHVLSEMCGSESRMNWWTYISRQFGLVIWKLQFYDDFVAHFWCAGLILGGSSRIKYFNHNSPFGLISKTTSMKKLARELSAGSQNLAHSTFFFPLWFSSRCWFL